MNNTVFSSSEKITFALRELYARYGYSPYRMSKFEEYDLYGRNKDFLISDSVITFTDTNGKLMALKPDVTLSIIKNNRALSGSTRKLFYNENVYRVSKGTNSFKEIMQAGIECLGDIDDYLIGECVYLAWKSLGAISERFVLDVSSLDILLAFVGYITDERGIQDEIIKCVSEKNTHGIIGICRDNDIDPEKAEPLCDLLSLYGSVGEVLPRVCAMCETIGAEKQAQALKGQLRIFDKCAYGDSLRLDFSVVSDRNYYNGVIFKGFVEGVPGAVLSGGQYDKLMQKMHRRSRAIGFAVYLDMLERLGECGDGYDMDAVLLYDASDTPEDVVSALEKLIAQGISAVALKEADPKLRYRETYCCNSGEVEKL